MAPRKAVKSPNLSPHGGARKLRTSNRSNYAASLELPKRWRTILVGFILVLVIRVFCSDSLGNLRVPPLRECFYIVPVIPVASYLLYIDWRKKTSRLSTGIRAYLNDTNKRRIRH
jgi:hypothetical protein